MFTTAMIAALSAADSGLAQCQYSVTQWAPWACEWEGNHAYTGTGLNDLGAWCGYRLMCWPEEGEWWLPIYCPPGGMPQVLPMPPNADSEGAQATALNNTGFVVGWYRRPPWNLDTACAWLPDGSVIDLFPIASGDRSNANDVNDAGVIVGVHWIANGTPSSVPFVWSDGAAQFLDPAP
ncbi:MAG: hypothetical protein FJ253_11050, partial [Phycisphaerae bacterium]|nr:hypothetical protein [Phycisphaerae bacterium]